MGAIEIRGKIGGLQFCRNSDGSPGVRRAAVVNKQRMKTGQNFARVRDNIAEFTGAGRTASALRMALGDRVEDFCDSQLQSRLTAITRRVIGNGSGIGGQRKFEVGVNLIELEQVVVNKQERFRNRFKARYQVTVNPDRNTATLDIPSFDPMRRLRIPQGGKKFQLVLSIGVVSDFSYTGNVDVYAPDHPTLSGLTALVESTELPVNTVTQPLQLIVALPGFPVLPVGTVLVVSLGVEFFREVNSQTQVLATGNAMQVVGVY